MEGAGRVAGERGNLNAIYEPSAVQQEFHLCAADEAMIGGSGGPGKSLALLMDPFMSQIQFEHQRWMRGEIHESEGKAIHFRREFPMLAETIDRSHRIFLKIDPKAHWDGDNRTWRWSCGYKHQFAHMKESRDWMNYDSNQYDHVGFDELWQFEAEQYMRLTRRCRSSDPFLRKLKRVRSATIPAGNWVRDYFVKPAREGRKLLTRTYRMDDGTDATRTRLFIPALLRDNPDAEFRRDYELNLRDSPPHIRKALLEGDWWAIAGAFFDVFDHKVHVVEPFKIPDGWFRFRSMDWGMKNWGTVGWYAVNTDGDMDKYREFNFKGLNAAEVAEEIHRIEDNAGEWDNRKRCSRLSGPADTQIWSRTGTVGPTIAEEMSMRGVFWEKCTKNKPAAAAQLYKRLKDRGEDGKGRPGIRFFRTCKRTVETIPSIGTSETNAEEPADGGDDHWLDETLYACMYRSAIPKRDKLPFSRELMDELGMARDRMRRQQRNPSGGWRTGYGR